MRGKILFVVGLGVGYVLGTRAGREKYDQLKATVTKFWNDPRVQERVDDVQDFVKDKAPDVAEFLADGAKKVVSQVSGANKSTASKPAARKPASKSTTSKSSSASSAAK
ncbi:YtxH domain-containing protein [Antiquaquibacter soli]|uniref:YtxH domain-containing protein n=1 Tax=Antiquaquibacter soli TaxID=3064523 RepID=A0ABT9BRB2_9MICO|nr:YtxH domain-containing protein [Protaetiibacter sp. WY-16]MDO7883566.1 YtxH domain-containing protein [Protaetiibacter sp. WY-16]